MKRQALRLTGRGARPKRPASDRRRLSERRSCTAILGLRGVTLKSEMRDEIRSDIEGIDTDLEGLADALRDVRKWIVAARTQRAEQLKRFRKLRPIGGE